MKKIISTLLTTLLILSLLVTPASATSQSNTQDAVLHFDANSAIKHWQPFSKVYCHIWEYDGEAFYPWHSDKSICTDADNDGEISILDATAIGLHLASLDELSEEEQLLSDIDFDSKVSILDATKIQRKLADYIFY